MFGNGTIGFLRSVKHVMRAFECICSEIITLHPETKYICLAFLEFHAWFVFRHITPMLRGPLANNPGLIAFMMTRQW